MITVNTELDIHVQGAEHFPNKYVTMRMEPDDALALATVLMNLDDEIIMISPEWNIAFRRLSHKIIDAANACRT
jgi:hypothetical protein